MIVAESAGFCFGVERAVNTVYEELEKQEGPLYTYGPIIHNEAVVDDLKAKGVNVIEEDDDLSTITPGTVVIRSHGVSRKVQENLEKNGFRVVDATCPFVKKIHRIVAEASARGDGIIIIGDRNHPEVQGIMGWSTSETQVAGHFSEVLGLKPNKNYYLVAQTTFNTKKFEEIVEKIAASGYNVNVVNTICNATQRRQSEAEAIASEVDAMIVIGGSHSSNTRKLCDICRANCGKTYYIQTLVDLIDQGFGPVRSVGITAGASTPKKIIEEVQTYVRSEF